LSKGTGGGDRRRYNAFVRATLYWLIFASSAFAQQVAFTSRAYVLSPVTIVSTDASKQFGFESITLRNDGPHAITAVHVQIMFHSEVGEEIADERRVAVNIDPRETRRFVVDLGHVDGLKQLARSRRQPSALAILTVESVEFADGSEWKQSERDHGAPVDPLMPQELKK
jgi:hypothetical protein